MNLKSKDNLKLNGTYTTETDDIERPWTFKRYVTYIS